LRLVEFLKHIPLIQLKNFCGLSEEMDLCRSSVDVLGLGFDFNALGWIFHEFSGRTCDDPYSFI